MVVASAEAVRQSYLAKARGDETHLGNFWAFRPLEELEAALIADGLPIDRLKAPKVIEHDER